MRNDNQVILQGKNIIKYYGQHKVLDIKEFNIYQGKANFLLGPNGSGKTSLLNILALIDNDFQGEIYYRGKPIDNNTDLISLRRRFSIIWQNPYLYKGTIASNITLPLKLRKCKPEEIKSKLTRLACELNIEHLLNKRRNEISGGELQKVSIARSLITEPEILFIDEPHNNLDNDSISFYNQLFEKLVASQKTLFIITHDLGQIESLADYVTILKDGKVNRTGPGKSINIRNTISSRFYI